MNKRFKLRVTASTLAVVMHLIVIFSLSVHRPVPRLSSAATTPVLNIRLLSTGNQNASQQQADVINSSLASVTDTEAEKHVAVPDTVANTSDHGGITSEPEVSAPAPWTEWFPQLSSIPLFDHLPFTEQGGYFSGSELQERPMPEEPIIIPFPSASLTNSKARAILLLYISAEGNVDRVEVAESELPSEFEQAAVDTFMHAKMRPGIKDGKPVPARMKIEVEFETK